MGMDFANTPSAKTAKQRMQQAVASNTKDKVILIPIAKLSESPLNENMPLGNLEDLAFSIKENGLQDPVLVYKKKDGSFEIYAGHRRYRAMRDILKQKEIPCIAKEYPEDERVRFREHFTNNVERRENKFRYWMAEIIAARELLLRNGFNGTKRELVDETCKLLEGKVSTAQVYRYEAIEKMDPCIAELGDLGYSAYTLSKAGTLSAEQQQTLFAEVTEAMQKNEGEIISPKEFNIIVNSIQNDKSDTSEGKPKISSDDKYIRKLEKLETKIISSIGKPKNEQQKNAARETIKKIKLMLEEMENAF